MVLSRTVFAALVAYAAAEEAATKPELTGEVLVGEGDNWETWTTQFEFLLAEFYAPWCGHCKKLDPEYTKAAEMLHAEGVQIPLVKIDATDAKNEAGAKKYDIKGFPTLKWFTNGTPSDYDGPREAQGIVDWVKSMTGPAVEEKEPTGEEKISVAFFGEDMSVFEEVAKANRKKAQWFHVKSTETPKIVIKHLGEDAVETTSITTKEEMETFFKDNQAPLFGELNGETFGTYMEAGGGLVWTLLKFDDADAVKGVIDENRAKFSSIAKKIGSEYAMTWTNTVEFGKVLESMFGITEFPRVIVQTKAGAKKNFIYDGEMDEDKIVEYIEKVKAGEVQPHLKSEAAPEEPQEDPVKVVVGSTLEKMVFTEDKDVLLEVYAPWCGHCKKLEPEYIKVAKKVEKEGFSDILTIAKLDGTLNDSPVDSLEWSGFPTIYYVKAGNPEPVKYDGGRDAKGIWKWIKKNHSKADLIKAKIAEKKAKKDEEVAGEEAPKEESKEESKDAEAKEEL